MTMAFETNYLFRRLGIPRLGVGGRIILLKRILLAWTILWCTLYSYM